MICYVHIHNILLEGAEDKMYIFLINYIIYISKLTMYKLTFLYSFISNDFFANSISLLGLILSAVTIFVGGIKVSEALREYNQKKRAAVFSYHINMKIFIMRLKRLVSNNQGRPLKSLYLFSSINSIREQGNGYEKVAELLFQLSKEMLDYLSTEPNQIPASISNSECLEWDQLIAKLVNYLTDFLLYNSDAYLPQFDEEKGIVDYHNELMSILNRLLELIENSKNGLIAEINEA